MVDRIDAFGEGAVESGAVLPVTDRQFLDALDSLVTGNSAASAGHDRWLADGVPALARGDAWILPYLWQPASALEVRDERDRGRSSELWNSIRSWCWYQRGDMIGVDLSPEPRSDRPRAYAKELLRTGARRADWWGFGSSAVVSVVYGNAIPAPITAQAVHVVPHHWVWYDRGRPGNTRKIREMPATSLEWSWADVVALR